MITDGVSRDGRTLDRSAALLGVAMAMIDAAFTRDEILSVLTDRQYALGETGYDHRQTSDRQAAGAWIDQFCLLPAYQRKDARAVFAAAPPLEDYDRELELSELINGAGPRRIANSFDATTVSFGGESGAETGGVLAEFSGTHVGPWQSKLQRPKSGMGLLPTYGNIYLILKNDVSPNLMRRNSFAMRDIYGAMPPWSGENETVGAQVTDDSIARLKNWLVSKWHVEPPVSILHEVATAIALENEFHPIKNELEALPAWDGVERVDRWLVDHFGATRDPAYYVADVFRKWLVAAVTRIYQPGTKYDDMPILEGIQGVKKSMFGEVLFGSEYYLRNIPRLDDKDAVLNMQGKWCVEFAELASMKRDQVEVTKAFISSTVDTVRRPYGRRAEDIKRQSVPVGTTNADEYFSDRTGNRRFNPIHVGVCDIEQLKNDREQLWAEVLYLYNNCLESELYLTGESKAYAEHLQKEKIVSDASDTMGEAIATWFAAELERLASDEQATTKINFQKFKVRDLFYTEGPLGGFQSDHRNWIQAGLALKDPRAAPPGYYFEKFRYVGFVYHRLNKSVGIVGT